MEKALRHILEVYRQVRRYGSSRIDATKIVAKKHRISQQSVMSACTRDAGIRNAAELDYLIKPENASEFRSHLIKRYPHYQKAINKFFKVFGEPVESTDSATAKIETLFDDERENLLNQLMIQIFKDKLIEWENRVDIPSDVRKQIQEWLGMIRK